MLTFLKKFLGSVGPRDGWFPWSIKEPFSGAWQKNVEWKRETVLSFYAIFACVSLISSDISKMRIRMVRHSNGIWSEIPITQDYGVLTKPNNYQTWIQFAENWMNSKLIRGNAYILIDQDGRGRIKAMHVLNPDLVQVLVSDDGEVFYQLSQDNLSGIKEVGVTIPARYMIHDRFNCLFHPLCGLSPIFACGLAASQGLSIQKNATVFFENMSRPSGILTSVGNIDAKNAKDIKEAWETNYSNGKIGSVAVLSGDMKYQALTVNAKDAEMVDQLRMTAEVCCSAYRVPKHKVGVGDAPSYNNIEALDQQYYSQCLQSLIEAMELLLDEALGLKGDVGVELDLGTLLRMDTKTQMETLKEGVDGGILTPNEARARLDLKGLTGGDTIYLQQQDWPMDQLSKRSVSELAPNAPAPETPAAEEDEEKQLADMAEYVRKELAA